MSPSRQRVTVRRIDPWSMLKFGFVVNLVLLGIELLLAMVVWTFVRRLELIERICDLATSIGFRECGVDGGALFDTVLVLGLLGVVIQTGIIVFLTFLANLIFDLTGGIRLTLEDGGPVAVPGGNGGQTLSAGRARRSRSKGDDDEAPKSRPAPLGTTAATTAAAATTKVKDGRPWPGDKLGSRSGSNGGDDTSEDLFGDA